MGLNLFGVTVPSDQIKGEAIYDRKISSHSQHRGVQPSPAAERGLIAGHYSTMLVLENTLFSKSFNDQLAMPDTMPSIDRKEAIAQLNEEYQFFGLSTGEALTDQLVREIEKAAVAKARETYGRTV